MKSPGGFPGPIPYSTLVPKRRLELLQACAHQTLNLARLPVPPLRPCSILSFRLPTVKTEKPCGVPTSEDQSG